MTNGNSAVIEEIRNISHDSGTITFSVDWYHPATTTNFKVAWALDAVAIPDNSALNGTFGSAVQVNDTGGTTNKLYISPTSTAVTIGGTPAPNNLVIFRIRRVATDGTNDTLAVDAGMIGVRINFGRLA